MLALSDSITGKVVNDTVLINVIDMKKYKLSYQHPIIIVLLSNVGCSPCQTRILQQYQNIYTKRRINIIGIFNSSTNDNDREIVLKLKKASGAEFPIYCCDEGLIQKYSFAKRYPQILFIAEYRIYGAIVAIPEDDKFNKWCSYMLMNKRKYFK